MPQVVFYEVKCGFIIISPECGRKWAKILTASRIMTRMVEQFLYPQMVL